MFAYVVFAMATPSNRAEDDTGNREAGRFRRFTKHKPSGTSVFCHPCPPMKMLYRSRDQIGPPAFCAEEECFFEKIIFYSHIFDNNKAFRSKCVTAVFKKNTRTG